MPHVIDQCIAASLVKPDVHAGVDGTRVRANASIHSLKEKVLVPVQSLEDYLLELEKEDKRVSADSDDHPNDRRMTTTTIPLHPPPQSKKCRMVLKHTPPVKTFAGKSFPTKPIEVSPIRMPVCIGKATDRKPTCVTRFTT